MAKFILELFTFYSIILIDVFEHGVQLIKNNSAKKQMNWIYKVQRKLTMRNDGSN